MATSGDVKGRDYIVQWNSAQIRGLTSNELTVSNQRIDVTDADSTSDFKEMVNNTTEWSASATFNVDMSATAEGLSTIMADIVAGASGTYVLTTGVTGDITMSGTAFIDGSVSNPADGISTCSLTFEGSGVLSQSTS